MNKPAAKPTRASSRPAVSHFKPRRGMPGASLGLTAHTVSDLIKQIERGFSFRTFQSLASTTGLSLLELASVLGIPERTLARRRSAGHLAPGESARLLRVSTIVEKTMDLFEGDRPAALRWLTTPRRALDHHSPLAYSRTGIGAREVENLIGRLEHGVFS